MLYPLSLLPSVLIMLLACGVGVLLMRRIWGDADLPMQWCFGPVLGLVGMAWVGFLLALVAGLNWITIGLTSAIFLAALFFLRPIAPSPRRPVISVSDLAYYSGWLLFFGFLFSRVIVMEADGLHTAPANNYGDLAFHFSVVTSFADGDNFPPYSPIFHGLKFTYPFLIDFLTAFLHRAGANWAAAFFLPNMILSLATVGLLDLLTRHFTKGKLAGRLTPVLFFFSGGAGFIYAARDGWQSQGKWLDFLLHLPQSYTKNDELNLQWGNMVTTLIVPQRSLLFGVPVFAMIVILWWKWVHHKDEERETEMGRGEDRGRWLALPRSLFSAPQRRKKISAPRRRARRANALSSRARLLFSDNGQRGAGAGIFLVGLARIFHSGRRAFPAASVVAEWHRNQNFAFQTASGLGHRR